jgi:hypothetical protein
VSIRFADFSKFRLSMQCTVDPFYFITIRHLAYISMAYRKFPDCGRTQDQQFFFDCNLHSLALHLNFFMWLDFGPRLHTQYTDLELYNCWLFLAAFLLIHSVCELKCVLIQCSSPTDPVKYSSNTTVRLLRTAKFVIEIWVHL